MNIDCGVIEDLISLYADDLCSADSKTLVELHTAVCPQCKRKLEDAMTKTVINEEPIINGLRMTRKHYLKLIIITLCICAVVIIPSVVLSVLNINEKYSRTVSWSSIKAERNTKKFAKYIENGEYTEASKLFELGYTLDIESETLLRQIMVNDWAGYFENHPITKVEVADAFYNNSGDIESEVDFYTDSEFYEYYEIHFITEPSGEFILTGGYGINMTDNDFPAMYDDTYVISSAYERYIGLPRTYNYSFDPVTWLKWLADDTDRSTEYYRYSADQLDCQKKRDVLDEYFSNGTASLWSEYKSKLDEIYTDYDSLAQLFADYGYNAVTLGEDVYKDETVGVYRGYFVRECTLGFDGFTVSFTLQNDGWGNVIIPESISYSGDAPKEFKDIFDKIFG